MTHMRACGRGAKIKLELYEARFKMSLTKTARAAIFFPEMRSKTHSCRISMGKPATASIAHIRQRQEKRCSYRRR